MKYFCFKLKFAHIPNQWYIIHIIIWVVFMKKRNFWNSVVDYCVKTDKLLWILIACIAVYDLLILKSISRASSANYFSTQLYSIIIGLCLAFILTHIDYLTLISYWWLIGAFSIFLMLYTIFFGINIYGSGGVNATAWISLGGRTFQPSELVKVGFIITLSKHLDHLKSKSFLDKPFHLLLLLLHAFVPITLCHLQGDDGAGVVFFAIFIFMCISAGIHYKYFLILLGAIVMIFPFLWNYVLSDYQIKRFTAIFNLNDATVIKNEGYQQYQSMISIKSGGFFGKGLFNGNRVASNIVTFQQSDFIFSAVGEELGFVGCTLLITSLVVLLLRILYIAKHANDDIGKFICLGFFGWIFLQTVSNIGMCLALLPVMGVTLPFYSAGGSSALCLYMGMGILESIYIRREGAQGIRIYSFEPKKIGYLKFKRAGY
jgi:rod shape determining protein RodA